MLKFFRHYFSRPKLHIVINEVSRAGKTSYEKVEKLCREQPDQLNVYCAKVTPLHRCIIYQQDALLVLLLKYGANPNDEFKIATRQGKPLQGYIRQNDLSKVILLALYGAEAIDSDFPVKAELYSAYLSAKDLFNSKQELKAQVEQINSVTSFIDAAALENIEELCTELRTAFKGLAAAETNLAIQQHYLEEAEHFRQLPGLFLTDAECSGPKKNPALSETLLQSTRLLHEQQQSESNFSKKY